jgi:hypothetical protein
MAELDDSAQFDEIVKGLTSPSFKMNASSSDTLFDDLDKEEKKEEEEDLVESQTEDEEVEEDDVEEVEEVVEEKEEKKEKISTGKKVEKEEVSDLDDFEPEIAKYVTDKLSIKLGSELGEFSTVEEIVDKLAEIVEESSTPEYASSEVEELDKFVKDGGDVKTFFNKLYENKVNLEDVDIDNVSDQKKLVKQSLKEAGLSETQIKRKLERYEESGVLQEEAEEALELLKENEEKNKKKLLRDQENLRVEEEKRNKKFISNVQEGIKTLKDIGGIPITDKDKKDLYNFIFQTDKEGLTPYQKKYSSDIKHLIKSAFFTMKEDVIFEKAANKGASNLAKELKEKLAQKGKRNKKSTGQSDEQGVDALEMFSRQLRRV